MNAPRNSAGVPLRLGTGIAIGLAIAYVDNIAFAGEVSPIVIVGLLLAGTIGVVGLWGRRGWPAAAFAWLCIPMAHLVKRVLGLPDTLHPNTYTSVAMLAAFTFAVTILGAGVGMVIHQYAIRE